ncbi:MAG: response regulator [Pseudomonadota bacterium]|nr:response regulator [Pseudomonadota bacterium]
MTGLMASSSVSPAARAEGPSGLLILTLLGLGIGSAGLLLWAVGNPLFAAAFLAGLIGLGGILLLAGKLMSRPVAAAETPLRTDVALLRAAVDSAAAAVAITGADGEMICANACYAEWLGGAPAPAEIEGEGEILRAAAADARRDGRASARIRVNGLSLSATVERAGFAEDHLLWKFSRSDDVDLLREAQRLIGGQPGERLGEAGIMVALADAEGNVLGANRAFALRATGQGSSPIAGTPLVELIAITEDGQFHFVSEPRGAAPLRILQVPVVDAPDALTLFLLLDDPSGGRGRLGREESANLNALLDFIPLGLALANVDGRFVYMNKAFRKSAGIGNGPLPVYPGDLVVDEDKAAVSDAVRRFARGPSTSSDMPVRLKHDPDEPVALGIAGARGLGEAAVILSLKDNSEADRLKRQVAQATKMQAVGQLAGGVAHDFNNILTAILGYCDLMLMRHTPGDSDYDDIQQIRSNSNRAAGLTRQLLAFSRQQTLRPRVLQLPDVIAEVSNLLKRLIGERVTLQVKHGRNLGAVRADPGQLEQVIVNLAVNGRDAMLAKDPTGAGTLTLQTYSVSPEDVRKMGTDILPMGEYTALRVTDTGTGIPPAILGKIFEPFFTTKEVGKGTGLGLSTVYGIVKQSGGFIFADSEEGKGTSFTIYLPVHRAEAAPRNEKSRAKEGPGELWGSGTILLVEDEAMVRAVAERALTRHGYTVLTAENGEVALEILAREEKVDLMISDVVMPTMDGPTTVREARKTRPDLPILFISGYAEEQLRKSIDLERVAFLAKPFSVQKLAEAARDALHPK